MRGGRSACLLMMLAAFAIRAAAGVAWEPRHPALAAWEGGVLLVWQEGRIHYTSRRSRILARTLALDGTYQGGPWVLAEGAPHGRPQVACLADGRCLVVWQRLDVVGDWDVLVSRLDATEGRVLDPGGHALGAGPRNQALPEVAAAADRFAVAWQHMAADGFYELRLAVLAWGRPLHEARPWPLRYTAAQAARWSGYTPGWGWGRRPVTPARAGSRIVLGGTVRVAPVDGQWWLLEWQDQANWRPGRNIWIRLALVEADGTRPPRLLKIGEPPDPHSGQVSGRLVLGGSGRWLRGAALVTGRGGGIRVALGRLFDPMSPEGWRWLAPAQEDGGWRPARRWPGVFRLFGPVAVEGPLAGAWGHGRFWWVARAAARGRQPSAGRLLLAGMDAEGRPVGRRTVRDGPGLVADPALAVTPAGLLVVFREDASGAGAWRLRRVLVPKEGLP